MPKSKKKRKLKKSEQWKARALSAEARAEDYARLFEEKTGMSIFVYIMSKIMKLVAESPRSGVIMTNVEAPVA